MRKIYWYITGYIAKHWVIFAFSLVFAIVVFSFVVPQLSVYFKSNKTQYIGLVGEYTLNSLPLSIKKMLSVGLTDTIESQEVVPLLAERWVIEDDGKRYRFILKSNLEWQDGKQIVPEDINYQFADVETITTPSDVIFKLPDVFAPFPSVVSEPVFRWGTQKYWWFFERPILIGIGKNKISSYTKQANRLSKIVIEGPEHRLVYRFYLTESDAIIGFKKGEIDILPELSSPRDLADWDSVDIDVDIKTDRYLAVFFNNSHPLLQKNVRQALAYSIEKPSDELRARGPINPDSWAYLEAGKDYEKDVERAVERLLDGLPSEKLELDLTTTTIYEDQAEKIKQQWEELGVAAKEGCQSSGSVENKDLCENLDIKINIKISNFPDTNNFNLLLVGQNTPSDPDQYFLWHSDQPTNFTQYKNTRIDSLLEKGRKTLDQKERRGVYQEFQQFLLEDPPAIFLNYLPVFEVRRK